MAKTAQQRINPITPAAPIEQPNEVLRTRPSEDDIAVRAYHIYLSREGADGSPLEDWLQAERELTEEINA
jgi:DUF2934 family protein